MAEIRPFKGLVYDSSRLARDISCVVAPPYDVISNDMRNELYNKNDHNVIRLILGKDFDGDNESINKYTRAKELLDKWQRDGILARDEADALYVYLQEYEYRGKRKRRVGFFALLKIDENPKETVLPHEFTLAKPKEDRLNLIKEVESNLSPIFTLFNDSNQIVSGILENAVNNKEPFVDITVEGVTHKLWRLTAAREIEKIVGELKEKKVFIADGHHRYEVAMMYRNLRRKEIGYDGSADYVLMYFVDMSSTDNLTVMPTHRVLKDCSVKDDKDFISKVSKYFDALQCNTLDELISKMEEAGRGEHFFGFFGGDKYILIKSKNEKSLLDLVREGRSEDWKKLDVSILHAAIFDNLLSLNSREGNITYVKDAGEAVELVRSGSHKAAFFINSTRVDELRSVAEKGEMMPQKSTYFYPKLLSGLVINKFEARGVRGKNGIFLKKT